MPKLSIYVPTMKLQRIDLYCKEKGFNRSAFLANLAVSYINKTKGIVQCAKCLNGAIGNFKLTVHDWEQGEVEKTMFLCERHLNVAKKEGTDVVEQ